MSRFAEKYSTKSNKFFNYNYSQPGYYFITLCTYYHNNLLGKIVDNKIVLSKQGKIANDLLIEIPQHFPSVCLTASIIMPNHLHILFHVETPYMASLSTNTNQPIDNLFQDNSTKYQNNIISDKETPYMASLQDNRKVAIIKYNHRNHPSFYSRINQKSKQTIPKIIQQYKAAVKRNAKSQNLYFSWQSGYYDIIVKDTKQLFAIKKYIVNNPVNWQKDKYFK